MVQSVQECSNVMLIGRMQGTARLARATVLTLAEQAARWAFGDVEVSMQQF